MSRIHDRDGERISFGGIWREEQRSDFSCLQRMGETRRESAGDKNITSLMFDYELESHGHPLGNPSKAVDGFQMTLNVGLFGLCCLFDSVKKIFFSTFTEHVYPCGEGSISEVCQMCESLHF